ncbi:MULTISPECIES: type-F conjugative transfer system secretin TraK [Sphingobium]|uniref:Conjugal transfer protein TraK n=2 Tax=Sphingobium TaxID=165695 RepID=A0A0M3ALC9_9SPHN|nr:MULTISPECIES: type-F conjugative transfer system secretin TraK [Sphingobium]OAP30385.1 conjugal transfer protein TraK [Sphingobium sp. 20006FA]KKW89354.1 conjugal transfer protein TraK [Sphingobium chungbukense]KXU30837.1 conjugal transfer protein TraK [Sphingobium sp. AM]KYC30664.1 conjugal transfer protein TraK [Sphingobium sp. 22B]MCB4858999.1 type-F conjugative transfer system secretin TraK [Sphingobium sp. PNB]
MMSAYVIGSAAGGLAFLSRLQCFASRMIGLLLLGLAMLLISAPAFADQNIVAADSAQVDCQASAKDLTRISLVEDEFASVSKISTGNPTEDFSVVNEPVRGDIYLSVPDGFQKGALSFFGTSKRGYVYKFLCRITGDQAAQIFVTNPAIARERAEENSPQGKIGPQDAAVALMQAMAANGSAPGYEMRQRSLRPVYVGTLKVQMIAEYRGADLTGKVLRIENKGAAAIELNEATVAPSGTLAVSIAEPRLGPGKITTAYLVSQNGRP